MSKQKFEKGDLVYSEYWDQPLIVESGKLKWTRCVEYISDTMTFSANYLTATLTLISKKEFK